MGALNPVFLIAAAAIGIPILLHLLHRQRVRKVIFPAIRYLRRTEKEHARKIRIRQLLLLLMRCAAIALLVGAGARLFLRGQSEAHDPTALAIIIDNSMSSGRVTGETRFLDELKARAEQTLAAASTDDVIWVIRAAEPWDVAPPGGVVEADLRVSATEVSHATADLGAAIDRAEELLVSSSLPVREIHVLSDLQASAVTRSSRTGDTSVPVIVWDSPSPAEANRYVSQVLIGGGLPPLANQRTDVAVTLGPSADTSLVPIRLVLDGRIRAASSGRAGETVVLSVGPFQQGLIVGWVETDPDGLSADDRHHLAFGIRPPVKVASNGPTDSFLENGLAILQENGRVERVAPQDADVLFADAGAGVEGARAALVVLPPIDETLLPGLNRRLAAAGIPWTYGAPQGIGEVGVEENRLPFALEDTRVARYYRLSPEGGGALGSDVPVRLTGGAPLVATGATSAGPYFLWSTPFSPAWSSLPVSAEMIPALEWITSQWSAGSGSAESGHFAGQPLPLPSAASSVIDPEGRETPVDGARMFRTTRRAGLYQVLMGDSVLERVAVNPPVSESDLTKAERDEIDDAFGGDVTIVDSTDRWSRAIFSARQGPEVWRALVGAAVLLLLFESWFAATGAESTQSKKARNLGSDEAAQASLSGEPVATSRSV